MSRLSPRTTQRLAMVVIWASGALTVGALLFVVLYVLVQGIPLVTADFLLTPPAGGIRGEGGISTTIVTTLYLIVLTLAFAMPPGVGAAIYMSEYASDNALTRAVRFGIEALAGVPSIVFGLFGFALFVVALNFRFSILSGSLTLACLVLPTVIRTSEEAIRAVPRSYREGALALGSTKWQGIWHVVLPTAVPGILTAVILTIGRVVGETACLYVTMGGSAAMPTSLFSGGRSLALHLFYLAMETRAFDKAMATGAVLIAIILSMNALTNWLSARFRAGVAMA